MRKLLLALVFTLQAISLAATDWRQSYDSTQCAGGACVPRQGNPFSGPPATYDAGDYWRRIAPQVGDTPERASAAKQAIVRVCSQAGNMATYGSGVVIRWAGNRYVLSVKHGLDQGAAITLVWADGRRRAGRVAAMSLVADLALIEADLHEMPAYVVSEKTPSVGAAVDAVGFGKRGRWRSWWGRVRRFTGKELAFSGGAELGDSGGPVIDRRGTLVGVIWGTDGRETVATSCETIRRWLEAIHPPGAPPGTAAQADGVSRPQQPPCARAGSDRTGTPGADASGRVAALGASIEEMRRKVERMERAIAKLGSVPGPQGERGPRGEPGPPYQLTDRDVARIAELLPAIRVVFAAGDDEDEPERVVEVPIGGELRIPPQRSHVRYVDAQTGKELAPAKEDSAPLGYPIRNVYKYRHGVGPQPGN